MQALSILSALSKNPKHRQLVAQSSLADTLLQILTSASTEAAKTAALNFASELSGSEAFRNKACANQVEWLRVFTAAISNDKPVPTVVQAEKALLRLSVMEVVRNQVILEGSDLTRALATVANCEAPDREESAAFAITVLCAFDLLDIRGYSALTRSVFSRKTSFAVKNSLAQSISSLGSKEVFGVFSIPSASVDAAAAMPPPPPPPMPEEDAAAAAAPEGEAAAAAAPEGEAAAAAAPESDQSLPPPPPPPMPAQVGYGRIDVELLSLFGKGVADAMLHVGEMCPSFFHAAFGILYSLSRSDEARAQIRKDVTPESLGLFSDAVAGFSFDALRLADVVGSL